MIFDSHCHIQFPAYDADRETIIKIAIDNNVKMIAVGTQKSTSFDAINLAKKYPGDIFATIGFHPNHLSENWHHDKNEQGEAKREVFNYDEFKNLALDKSVVAIGECGLDYYRLGSEMEKVKCEKEEQKKVFLQQIEIAQFVKKPLMIHSRPSYVPPSSKTSEGRGKASADPKALADKSAGKPRSTDDAYLDSLDILKEAKFDLPAVFHFYVGGMEITKKLVAFGANFTFGGVVTFSRDYDEIIKIIPMERILIETDAPYVAPMPNRGKRNEPAFILETYKKIAEIKGISYEELEKQVSLNNKRIFGI